MTNTFKGIGIVALIFLTAFALFQFTLKAYGSVAVDGPANVNAYKVYDLFASTTAETTVATTTTATSTNISSYFDSSGRLVDGAADLRGAKRVTFYFSRGGATSANTGASKFRIQTTRDGTNWDDYSHLLGVDASVTATSTVTITAATSTAVYNMDLNGGFKAARCIVVETTDGEHACSAAVTY